MEQQHKDKHELVKYVIIIAVVAIAIIVFLTILSPNTGNVFSNIIGNI